MRRKTSAVTSRVAQRGVAAEHRHAEARGDGLEPVRCLLRMDHRRQQQRVEHRLLEAHAGAMLPSAAGSACRRRRCARPARCRSRRRGRPAAPRRWSGWPATIAGVMPWIGIAGGRDVASRIDELLEAVLAAQLAVDDARRADLDDLVARRRIEPGGLGVEHRVAQVHQAPFVEFARLARWAGTGRSRSTRAGCRCACTCGGRRAVPAAGASGSRKRK